MYDFVIPLKSSYNNTKLMLAYSNKSCHHQESEICMQYKPGKWHAPYDHTN